jgi:hypothetical protein
MNMILFIILNKTFYIKKIIRIVISLFMIIMMNENDYYFEDNLATIAF